MKNYASKYAVIITWKSGRVDVMRTDTDVRLLNPVPINGGMFLVTEESQIINADMVRSLEVIADSQGKRP